MRSKIVFIVLVMGMLANILFAEVPMHNPALDSKCLSGFQWSRDTASCKQADCPTGAGRTYTDDCNCGEAWSRPFRTCYDANRPGFVTSCVARGAKCPGEETTTTTQYAASIISFEGDVEYSSDGGETFQPLSAEVKLKQGDYVSTGFDSRAVLNFSYATLTVTQLTQFRIDEYSSRENINRTQIDLYVGSIRPRNIKHIPAIRSDFSVTTPTASSSIRGSEMIVGFDNITDITTVNVTEDMAYVKGANDLVETTVNQGQSVSVDATGKINLLEGTPQIGSISCCGIGLVPLILFGILTIRRKQ